MNHTNQSSQCLDDRVSIYEVVQRERVARDMQQWNELAACYNPDSEVSISWFQGTGQAFAEASEKMAAGGMHTFHQMGPTITNIRGSRALASTGCAIHLMGVVDDCDVAVIGQARLYSRLERLEEEWLISGFRVAYIADLMVPLNPSRRPELDAEKLLQFRSSYRYICFLLSQNGRVSRQDCPGTDDPASMAALLNAEQTWLNTTSDAPSSV